MSHGEEIVKWIRKCDLKVNLTNKQNYLKHKHKRLKESSCDTLSTPLKCDVFFEWPIGPIYVSTH